MSSSLLSPYQAVILCGGQGTRIRAVAEDRPKPMVDIGDRPILWHIMKIYSHYGVRRFILALGHQGEKIIDYFTNYHARNNDFTMRVSDPGQRTFHSNPREAQGDTDVDQWEITFAHTGAETMTGGRLRQIQRYIDQDQFLCTYGDCVSNVDIASVFKRHRDARNVATLVGVHMPTTFGVVESNDDGRIVSFREKPVLPGYINGGFFVFSPSIFEHIEGDSTILEEKPFRRLVQLERIGMVPHTGFWHAMDHFKDYMSLNELWKRNAAPWKVW